MNNFTIIPSRLNYKSSPLVDLQVNLQLEEGQKELIQWVRNSNINLAQLYDDERQTNFVFRPTFKVGYIYDNTYTGTTTYLPFQYNLFYVEAAQSKLSNIWKGFPQYFEFDFFRPRLDDGHFVYKPQSAYTYNWTYYITQAFQNDYTKEMEVTYSGNTMKFQAQDGIPFVISNSIQGGANIISFQCFAPHGLSTNEFVELSISYGAQNIFSIFSLGNDNFGSSDYVFNLIDIGYTGGTFDTGLMGTFKRVVNSENLETKSKYYIRNNKVLANESDIEITKAGFELNPFKNVKQYEFSSVTPNNVDRISTKTLSNTYTISLKNDLILSGVTDNQKREISEIFLTIVNKGFSGYFNKPFGTSGLKEGWLMNITKNVDSWWSDNNTNSNSNIPFSSYTLTNGSTKTFYYNQVLEKGDIMGGDFCEWNDYYQIERVVSPYVQKIKFNQDVFTTSDVPTTNSQGYYYFPHNQMPLRIYSNYIETAIPDVTEGVPNYAFYSSADNLFRWREPFSIGEFDNDDRGVVYPFVNGGQYPFQEVIFKLIPEGSNYQSSLPGYQFISYQPVIDDCE